MTSCTVSFLQLRYRPVGFTEKTRSPKSWQHGYLRVRNGLASPVRSQPYGLGTGFWSGVYGNQFHLEIQAKLRSCKEPAVHMHQRGTSVQGIASGEAIKDRKPIVQPPKSREEAIQQARLAITMVLGKSLKGTEPKLLKQKRKGKQQRFIAELPLLDDETQTLVDLTKDILAGLFDQKRGSPGIGVYFADKLAAELAMQRLGGGQSDTWEEASGIFIGNYHVASIESLKAVPETVGAAFLVGPNDDQLASLQRVVSSAGPKPIVALNPRWYPDEKQEQAKSAVQSFAETFEVCYSFVPLSIQGLFSKSEGAVLKFVQGGAPAGTPWLIFTKKGETLQCVNMLKKRPTPADLETALYLAVAESSPVNRSIDFVKSLFGKR